MDFHVEQRISWIKERVKESHTKGVVIGLSGGKDSSVVAALCVKALGAENVFGVALPCHSITRDVDHAKLVAETFGIEFLVVDIGDTFNTLKSTIEKDVELSDLSTANIKPRLRMSTLYAIAQTKGYLVAGTDNLSEMTMGYFTKWGDGGYDFNPLSDLTVSEVLALGKELGVPAPILEKPPSAGLWEGQTDEQEMGVTYAAIEEYIKTGTTDEKSLAIIERVHKNTEHKRVMPYFFRPTK
ncbi:MAG: NAD(+) synthase [Epulopiscium sp. Nele67-Bin005]|nr:MAG: NAD(+) synthase [Epulopiscium sp. Nele67-Bin005]